MLNLIQQIKHLKDRPERVVQIFTFSTLNAKMGVIDSLWECSSMHEQAEYASGIFKRKYHVIIVTTYHIIIWVNILLIDTINIIVCL